MEKRMTPMEWESATKPLEIPLCSNGEPSNLCPEGTCDGCDRTRVAIYRTRLSIQRQRNRIALERFSPRTVLMGIPGLGWLLRHSLRLAWPNTGGKSR